ncbi:hypothetical protein [Thermoactinospora rubra]|uniref:hypothetical protein n=1 Tax=Thermoactinospora rubra TaxID=1088767 RepID=UPI00117D2D5D|nr:hypothetical protein [Thermoactinospora rubra]
MTAVIVILVAVVLLVLVVVALGMRSMNKRESSLPPERMKELAEKEELKKARSTDEFAAHEPRMTNFSPDFSPIDEEEKPKPVRTGQRGKRGVDEWGNVTSDDEDEEFWASIRSDAAEGGFGASGTVKARKAASSADRRPAPGDPNAATVQAPLPQRQVSASSPKPAPIPAPAPAAASHAEPRTPSQKDLADQRTVTFAAPTPDVMSILGPGSKPVPPPSSGNAFTPASASTSGSFPAANGTSSGSFPAANGTTSGSFTPANGTTSGSFPAANGTTSGSFPAATGSPSGSFPAVGASSTSGSFPAATPSGSYPASPIHGAPNSDPFPAYANAADALESTWQTPPPSSTSGSWPASPDILDDPAPASGSGSWPAFEAARPAAPAASYSASSYEVRPGYAAPDGDALTGPSPAVGTPTAPGRAVSPYDDVLSSPAYERAGYSTPAAPSSPAAWPEPPADMWPSYGQVYGSQQQEAGARGGRASRRRSADPQQDYPDYYR